MPQLRARLAGVELYFDNLPAAQHFYQETLGLRLTGAEDGHHAQFDAGSAFLCVERKGVEAYPSQDKAVIFLEVEDVKAAVKELGKNRVMKYVPGTAKRSGWAVFTTPRGIMCFCWNDSPGGGSASRFTQAPVAPSGIELKSIGTDSP